MDAKEPTDALPRRVPSAADLAALQVMRLGWHARDLAKAKDPGAPAAETAYRDARTAAEDAGFIMRCMSADELQERFGHIVPVNSHVSVGAGWRTLVVEALERLSHMHVEVIVIREKFAGLDMKVYPRDRWRDEDFDAVSPAKALAVEAAMRTCEACGQPGTLRRDGRWRTRCDAHVDL